MVIADLVDTLSRIGAIGGILSIVGVGLLILLVASQSRQIRSMREWIEEEPQRQQETAQRVIAEVQRRIAAARDRRAAATGAPDAQPAVRPLPPLPGTLGATPEAQKLAAKKDPAGPDDAISVAPPEPGAGPAFAPLTPAGGAESAEGAVLAPGEPTDEPAVVSEFLSQETQAADVLPDQDPLGSASASAPADVRFGDDHFDLDEEEHGGGSRMLFGVGLVALLAGIVLAFVLLFGGGSDEPKAKTDTPTETTSGGGGSSGDKKPSTPTAVDPGTVSVRVLNGTTISGLAQRVTDSLKGKGYGTDSPGTWTSDQTTQNTSVSYREGQKAGATQVAKDLGLSSSAVQVITADLSVAAGETAEVVVLTGTDLNSTSGTTGE